MIKSGLQLIYYQERQYGFKMENMLALDAKLFRKKFEKYVESFNQKLSEYISDPNEENIHDIRTSVRRLEAAYRVAPKKVRRHKQIRSYAKQAKKLFKLNAKIRDFDIICKKMKVKYPDKTLDLVSNLKNILE